MAACPACKSVIDEVQPVCPKCGAQTGRGGDAWDADLDVAWMDVDMTGDESVAIVDNEELIDLADATEHEAGTAVVSAEARVRLMSGDAAALEDPSVLPGDIVDFAGDSGDIDGATRAVSADQLKRMSSGEFESAAAAMAAMKAPKGPTTIPDFSGGDTTEHENQATVVWDDNKGRSASIPFGLTSVPVPDLVGAEDTTDGVTGATRNINPADEPGTSPGRPASGLADDEIGPDEEPDSSTTWLWVVAVLIIIAAAAGIIVLVQM